MALYLNPINLPQAGFAMDENNRRVIMDGRVIHLYPLEFLLMQAFVKHPNTVLTRKQLLREVWGMDFLGASRTVDMHVASLRKKLCWGNRIVTVHNMGYLLVFEKASFGYEEQMKDIVWASSAMENRYPDNAVQAGGS
jgi:DNA-binding response OmpR family regulator